MACSPAGESAQATPPATRHDATTATAKTLRMSPPDRCSGAVMCCLRLVRIVPVLSRGRQVLEERRRSPAGTVRGRKTLHGLDHARKARLPRPVHGASLVCRKPVTVYVHHVDVAGAQGDSLLHDARALVDQRMQQPIENLLIRYLPPRDAQIARYALDERGHLRIGYASATLVAIEAPAGLLPEAALRDQALENRRPALVGRKLASPADQKADVVAREVPYGERAHSKAEVLDDAIDLLRRRTLLEEKFRLRAVVHEHAIADEAVAVAGQHHNLAESPAEGHHGGDGLRRGALAAHVLEQLHEGGRAEEMRAHYLLRARGAGGDGIDVEGGGVGGQDRPGRGHLIEAREDFPLHFHVLEHRFDDDVGARERRVVPDAVNEGQALLGPLLGQAAARH